MAALIKSATTYVSNLMGHEESPEERQRQEADAKKREAMTELERTSNARSVDDAAEQERQERITRDRMAQVEEELRHQANAKEASRQAGIARVEAVEAHKHHLDTPPTTAAAAMQDEVLPQMQRRLSAQNVDAAAEQERQERITRDRMAQVEEELRHQANAKEASRQAGIARVEAVEARKHKIDPVSPGVHESMSGIRRELSVH